MARGTKTPLINRSERIAAMVDLIGADLSLQDFYTDIAPEWEEWIEYKYIQFGTKEQYKLPRTELLAIKHLRTLACQIPFVAKRLMEYAQAKPWKGFYLPTERDLFQAWVKESKMEPSTAPDFPHLQSLVEAGFPSRAWQHPTYFTELCAEVTGNYRLYVAETKAFFGPTSEVLSEQSWHKFCHQIYPYNANLDPTTINCYEVASSRLQWHIDYNDLPWAKNLDEFFLGRCKDHSPVF